LSVTQSVEIVLIAGFSVQYCCYWRTEIWI